MTRTLIPLLATSIFLNAFLLGTVLEKEAEGTAALQPEERVEAEQINWDIYIEALAWVESRWNDNAVGDKDDVGYLQITPVIVRDANRIIGYEKYTLKDRTDRVKSIEIFNVIQDNYNPQHDLNFGLKIWNSRAPVAYHRLVMAKYNELRNI